MSNYDKVIFFLPFAGGGAHSLASLAARVKGADTVLLEWPGRGRRMSEPFLRSVDAITRDIYREVVNKLDGYSEYFIFGHSMGATIAYLLAHKLGKQLHRYPVHLITSGAGAPGRRIKRGWHHYESEKFWQTVSDLGGCPREVIENDELRQFVEPIIRADFEALDGYEYQPAEPLPVPITALRGTRDEASRENFEAWQLETNQPLQLHELEGSHFFIFEQPAAVAELINQVLKADQPVYGRNHTDRFY